MVVLAVEIVVIFLLLTHFRKVSDHKRALDNHLEKLDEHVMKMDRHVFGIGKAYGTSGGKYEQVMRLLRCRQEDIGGCWEVLKEF